MIDGDLGFTALRETKIDKPSYSHNFKHWEEKVLPFRYFFKKGRTLKTDIQFKQVISLEILSDIRLLPIELKFKKKMRCHFYQQTSPKYRIFP